MVSYHDASCLPRTNTGTASILQLLGRNFLHLGFFFILCAHPHIKQAMAPGYTAEEKQWPKKQWGSEYYFLRAYGLSIFKDKDSEEGRTIVKAMREHDEDD
jgi:hypothetical protein